MQRTELKETWKFYWFGTLFIDRLLDRRSGLWLTSSTPAGELTWENHLLSLFLYNCIYLKWVLCYFYYVRLKHPCYFIGNNDSFFIFNRSSRMFYLLKKSLEGDSNRSSKQKFCRQFQKIWKRMMASMSQLVLKKTKSWKSKFCHRYWFFHYCSIIFLRCSSP